MTDRDAASVRRFPPPWQVEQMPDSYKVLARLRGGAARGWRQKNKTQPTKPMTSHRGTEIRGPKNKMPAKGMPSVYSSGMLCIAEFLRMAI